jgi:hypothetical protein
MFNGEFDSKLLQIATTVGVGAALGTIIRVAMEPKTDVREFVGKVIVSIAVGFVTGCAIVEIMNFGTYPAVAVGSACSILSEQIYALIRARGRKLEAGKIDISLKGDQ